MNYFILLFVNLLMVYQEPDSLVSVPNLGAFTHPKFFYSDDCDCSRFNFDFIYLTLYDTSTNFTLGSAIPPNFDVGHSVIITGKQGDFFRIKFQEGVQGDYEQYLVGKEFCVEIGTLGTWIYNYNDSIDKYDSVPLYEEPSLNSKIITRVEEENSVAIVLDINGSWMFVETIAKGNKKRGWLDPKMQCGNPYGIDAGICD
jgi:hypothetical protein